MIDDYRVSLESLLAPWPVADSISCHLRVGDLISLARTNSSIRASLHGFQHPHFGSDDQTTADITDSSKPRDFINIGLQDTLYWKRLKDNAAFECSSTNHTRGTNIHPCCRCSLPICEACIVKDSMHKGGENTFNRRCRSFCPTCWESGNVSKSRRFPLVSSQQHILETSDQLCTCTIKKDGWLCIPCKNIQNSEAASDIVKTCHGADCKNSTGPYPDRRRICMWCQKTLPSHLGSSFRLEWNKKIIEANQRIALSRQADLEEYNRKRLKQLRMSRRELRGDDAVEDDPQADVPQYIRHLDTFNYRRFMPDQAAPTGNQVYLSKKGIWTYSRNFLDQIGRFCEKLPYRHDLAAATNPDQSLLVRTNNEKLRERKHYHEIQRSWRRRFGTPMGRNRVEELHRLKPMMVKLLVVDVVPFEKVQFTLFQDHDFSATNAEYAFIMSQWGYRWQDNHYSTFNPAKRILDHKDDDMDLRLAIQLQEKMDGEAAQALQADLWNDEAEQSTDALQPHDSNRDPSPSRSQNNTPKINLDLARQPEDSESAMDISPWSSEENMPPPRTLPPNHPARTSSSISNGSENGSSSSSSETSARLHTTPAPPDDPPSYAMSLDHTATTTMDDQHAALDGESVDLANQHMDSDDHNVDSDSDDDVRVHRGSA